MAKKFIFLVFVAGLVAGYLIPKSAKVNDPVPIAARSDDVKLDALKRDLLKISEEDINDYIHLKESRAKYEKADEIFGKILNLFLIDLGLRSAQTKWPP